MKVNACLSYCLLCLIVSRGLRQAPTEAAEVREYHGVPTLFVHGKPDAAVIMHHYDGSVEGAAALAGVGVHLWEIDLAQPTNWNEVDTRVQQVLRGDPRASLILRVALAAYPDDPAHAADISTAGDGTRWSHMLGKVKWFTVGTVTEKDAPPRKWSRVTFDLAQAPRTGVVRVADLVIRHTDPHIPQNARLRFFLDQVEYWSSNNPRLREVVADMETTERMLDEGRYPQPPVLSDEHVKAGKRALLWQHVQDGKHDALVCKGVEAVAARDMTKYDRLSFWIYPDTDAPFRIVVRFSGGLRRMGYCSFASDRWASDYRAMLRRLIDHVERASYRDRVIGLTLAAGMSAEWCWAGHGQVDGVDFSPAATRKWRDWVRRKYGTVDGLRRAWGRDAKGIHSFDDVHVPTKNERLRPGVLGEFRCPKRDRLLVDYGEFIAQTTAARVAEFGRTVKECSKGRLLAGALFGYLFGYGDYTGGKAQLSGHAMPHAAVASPSLDFFAAPFEYHDRALGAPSTWTLPVDSIRAQGKLVINEADSFTHLAQTAKWLHPKTERESAEVLKRDVAASLAKGSGLWWFLQRLGGRRLWEEDKPLLRVIGRLNRLGQSSLLTDRRSVSEVAVVTDRRGFLCLHPKSLLPGLIFYQTPELYRMGAPFDIYLLDDIGIVAEHNYKAVVFFNTFWISEEQRAQVERLKRNGRTLVFTYAAGIAADELDLENIARLTGIRLAADLLKSPARVRLTNTHHPLTAGLPANYTFGGLDRNLPAYGQMPPASYPRHPPCTPIFSAADPEGAVLGVMTATGKPGMVVREFDHWNSVWVGAYTLSAPVLRGVLRFAGVHVYDDAEDVIYANRDWLAVHFSDDGKRQLRLPRPRKVTDAWTGKTIARHASTFTVSARRGDTRIFLLQ